MACRRQDFVKYMRTIRLFTNVEHIHHTFTAITQRHTMACSDPLTPALRHLHVISRLTVEKNDVVTRIAKLL